MKEIAELLRDLPWVTLLTLASGYAGYFISSVGLKTHHKNMDVAFSVLVFGLIAASIYNIMSDIVGISIPFSSFASFLATVICGALWNRIGRRLLYFALRKTDISYNDETPSAWAALLSAQNGGVRQLYVKLQDGTWLGCNNLEDFMREPNGACILGSDGDILMYVTHTKSTEETFFSECPDVKNEWGSEITYIPKSQIARVEIRRMP